MVYLPAALELALGEQVERVKALEKQLKRDVPYPFPHLRGRHKGEQIGDFIKRWPRRACELEGREDAAPAKRLHELKVNLRALSTALRHDFRRTAVTNMVNAGVPERAAMTITGHKTVRPRRLPHRESGRPESCRGGHLCGGGQVFGHVRRKRGHGHWRNRLNRAGCGGWIRTSDLWVMRGNPVATRAERNHGGRRRLRPLIQRVTQLVRSTLRLRSSLALARLFVAVARRHNSCDCSTRRSCRRPPVLEAARASSDSHSSAARR